MTDNFVTHPYPQRQLLFSGVISGLTVNSQNPIVSNLSWFTATNKYAVIFPSFPSAKTITNIQLYVNAKNGTPPTFLASLQSINSYGHPTGTILGGGSPASNTFTGASLTAGAWNTVTLSNSYAVAAGEAFAAVLEHSSGTVDFSNYFRLNNNLIDPPWTLNSSALALGMLYGSGTGWYNQEYDSIWIRVGDGTDTWQPGTFNANHSEVVYNNTDNPDEYGMKFQVAEPCYASHIASSFAQTGGTGRDIDHFIYDANDNVLASVNSTEQRNNSSLYSYNSPLQLDAPCLLLPGRDYRVTAKSNDATDIRLVYFDAVSTEAVRDHLVPVGYTKAGTNRNNSGSWTDETTRVYALAVLGYGAPSVAGGRRYIRVPRRGTNDKRGIIRRG